jgi:Tfp pilus assembly PilM family ATPase
MNIGYSVTNLVFVIKGFFYSMRDISIGMSTMWETVQSELSLSSDDMNKLQLGFYEHIEPSKLKQALYSATGDIKVSLDTAFTYLETVTQGLTVNKIYLSGGGALVPNMSDLIEERMNIGTDFLNPFRILFSINLFLMSRIPKRLLLYTLLLRVLPFVRIPNNLKVMK